MQYLLLGMAALLLLLLATRAYMLANPQVLARQLRIGVGVAALAGDPCQACGSGPAPLAVAGMRRPPLFP